MQSFAFALFIALASAGIGGFLAKKLKQPLILGYVLAGATLGWFAVSQIKGEEALLSLADIGIVLLMFSLGIEFSFTRLARVREIAVLGGIIQILVVILFGLLLFPKFGFDFYTSLFLGSCFALSSTAVVTKILTERGETETLSGEMMIGWLLVQDLAVLPIILILPKIASFQISLWWQIFLPIALAAVLLLAILVLSRRVVPKLMDLVAGFNSRELLLLSVVSLSLLAAFATQSLGLSFALGAFLAGLIVSESTQNHAIFSEIRPLRDVFSILFFVSLGMMLAPSFLWTHLGLILSLALVVVCIKFLVVSALVLYFGYHLKTAWLVGVGLTQVGEFSFILARLGVLGNLISEEIYSLTISVALLTIILTPWFFSLAPKFYAKVSKLISLRSPSLHARLFAGRDREKEEEELPYQDHVVICGFGRVGSWLGRALEISQIPFIVVDFNQQVIADLRKKGTPAVYGDPADLEVLDFAQVDKAKTVVVAIPDRHTQEMVIGHCQTLNPKAGLICRSHFPEDLPRLKALGVDIVIQPEFEASLSIIHRILQDFGVSKEEVSGKIKRIKIEHGMG